MRQRNQAPSVDYSCSNIRKVSELVRAQALSPVEVVGACLKRIDELNPGVNAFITVLADESMHQARIAEQEIRKGTWRGPLHDIPIGIKDMYDTAGTRTTAAFKHFVNRVPKKDAVAVSKLKEAGAIIIGKTNMHELAMGTTSLVSFFGPVHNPWKFDSIAGGSSGGSAAAVASGMCFATLDTDAVGSCRLPASCCGVVGFKGTYGLIDNRGVMDGEPVDEAILWLAHAALTTRSVEDITVLLNILAEPRPNASAEASAKARAAARAATDEKPRLGIATNFSASEEVASAFNSAVGVLRGLGYETRDTIAPLQNPGFDLRNIQGDRTAIAKSLFKDFDLLVLPTTAACTPKIEDAIGNPLSISAENTMSANYYGLPAISVPCGVDARGLPLGLQIVGKPWDEESVLELAHSYEANSTGRLARRSGEGAAVCE